MKNDNDWRPIDSVPSGIVVETKIHDEKGCRNEALLRLNGGLWWVPSGEIYVYYRPTHWRYPSAAIALSRQECRA